MEQQEHWNGNEVSKGKETRGNEKGKAESRENMADTEERKPQEKVGGIRR